MRRPRVTLSVLLVAIILFGTSFIVTIGHSDQIMASGSKSNADFTPSIQSSGISMSNAGYIKSTLVLGNDTLINGSFSPQNSIGPYGEAFDSENGYIYITEFQSGTVSVFDPNLGKVIDNISVGIDPYGIAYDQVNELIYVANQGSNNISVISSVNNTVISSFSAAIPYDIAIDTANNILYVSSESQNVLVFNATNYHLVTSIGVGSPSTGIVFDPQNNFIYVGAPDSYPFGNIVVINAQSNTIISYISNPNGSFNIFALAYDPINKGIYASDLTYLYFINTTTNTWSQFPNFAINGFSFDSFNGYMYAFDPLSAYLLAINSTTNKVNISVRLNNNTGNFSGLNEYGLPFGLVYDTLNGLLYLVNTSFGVDTYNDIAGGSFSTSIVAFNPQGNFIVGVYSVGYEALGIAKDPNNGFLYITSAYSGFIYVINDTTFKIIRQIDVGGLPYKITYDPANGNMYVADFTAHSIIIINSTSNNIVRTISFGSTSSPAWFPTALSYNPANENMYVASYQSGSTDGELTIINSSTNNTLNLSVGLRPMGLTYDPIDRSMYVSNYGSNLVMVVNSTSNEISDSIVVGSKPTGILFNPSSRDIYVSDSGSNNITIINGSSNGVVSTIKVGNSPENLAFDSNNNYVYAINENSDNISVINSSTQEVISSIKDNIGKTFDSFISIIPSEIFFDPVTKELYVSDMYSGTLSIISNFISAYSVNFTETGLPSGSDWYVNITGQPPSGPISGTSYSIYLSNGSYSYTVQTSNKIYEPSYTDSFAVNGNAVSSAIAFSQVTYKVTFTETGLPTGSIWYVNVTNSTAHVFHGSSTTNTITFNLINGTYSFANSTGDKIYEPSSYAGTFLVHGSAVNLPAVIFTAVTYKVTFTETGLPSGSDWYVNITGQPPSGPISGTSYSIYLSNGSYSYTVQTSNKIYEPSYTDSFAVNGNAVSSAIAFSQVTYKVTFTETGLPTGSIWYLNLSSGQTYSLITGTILFTEPNGTYPYTLATADKTYSPSLSSGSISVNGANASKSDLLPLLFGQL
ncbi:MAG: YncE family protein [Thermoplasmataceae archaeon]